MAAVITALVLTACNGPSKPSPAEPQPTPTPTAAKSAEDNPYKGMSQRELNRRLIAAAWDDDVKDATLLIEAGADVNAKDKTKQSAYLVSTSEGYVESARPHAGERRGRRQPRQVGRHRSHPRR